jgi:hypothetical protein
MTATLSTDYDGLLKRNYGAKFTDQQQLVPDFLEMIPNGSEKPQGEDGAIRFGTSLRVRQNGGAQRENSQFRENETGVKKQFVIKSRINIWNIELTNFGAAISESNEAAFASGVDREMKEALTMAKKDKNRQLFGSSLGQLCLVNGALVASTALVVDTPDAQYLFEGMRIDIWTAVAGVREAQNVQITAISDDGLTVTLATAVTVSNNSIIVRAGVLDGVSSTDDAMEVMGLEGMSDDNTLFTTFQGLSRATYGILKGTIIDASSAALTADILQRGMDKVEKRSGLNVDMIMSHRNQRRQYLSLAVPQKRFASDRLDLGFQTLDYNGIPWSVSHDCQRSNVYMYPKSVIRKWVTKSLALDNTGGSTVHKIPGKDCFEAYYKSYDCVGTYQPNAICRIKNLALLSE